MGGGLLTFSPEKGGLLDGGGLMEDLRSIVIGA